jgi:hypothetical protein
VVVACTVSTAARADTVYTLVSYSGFDAGWSFGGGSITTDGTIGSLTETNIVEWDVSFTSLEDTYTLNSGNSTVDVSGPGPPLSADLLGMTQTQSMTTIGGQVLAINGIGNQSVQWDAGGIITSSELILFDSDSTGTSSDTALLFASNNVATASSAVPEPSTLLALVTGFLVIAFKRRRGKSFVFA